MTEATILESTCPPPEITNPRDLDQQKAAFDWIRQHAPELDLVAVVRTKGFKNFEPVLLLRLAYDAPAGFHITAAALRHAKRLARAKEAARV